MIKLSEPIFDNKELDNLKSCLESGHIATSGQVVKKFESVLSKRFKTNICCTSSGTAALHTALTILDVDFCNIVIVPTLSFIATANVVKYMWATPVFMDCDDTLGIDPDKLESWIEEECEMHEGVLFHNDTYSVVSVIIISHLYGSSANTMRIIDIANKYNIKVVEDACEAVGATYKGEQVGTLGDVGCISFNGNKIITTGQGGAVMSKDQTLIDKARYYCNQAKDGVYVHNSIGNNYLMTDISASIGLAQIKKLYEIIKIRKRNYKMYNKQLKMYQYPSHVKSNYWFALAYIDNDEYSFESRPLFKLCHEQEQFKDYIAYKIEVAPKYVEKLVCIPNSAVLSKDDIISIIGEIKLK